MATEKWPSKDEYLRIRESVAQTEEGRDLIRWAETIERPKDADDLALRLAGTVITSGFSASSGVYEKVREALRDGTPIYLAFPNKKKARAIERIRSDRNALFERFKKIRTDRQASAWCDGIPYVQGPVIRFQAMRDLGAADVAKPDRHLVRIAERAGESVAELCARLARVTGDRIGTVDAILWYAASEGIIEGISRRRPRCR